jgi:putative flippase GtrA
MSPRSLVFRYILFAVIATFANLGVQRLILVGIINSFSFIIAICAGTVVGLGVKYFLDKRWIFYDHSEGFKSHGLKFSLYSLNGVFTTAVFWLSEFSFWYIWQTHFMREVGAIIGLSIGYITKYQLDRRFVFTTSR